MPQNERECDPVESLREIRIGSRGFEEGQINFI